MTASTRDGLDALAARDLHERRIDVAIGRYSAPVGLGIGTVLSPIAGPETAGAWILTGVLVAVTAAWTYTFATRRRRGPDVCGHPPVPATLDRTYGAVYVSGFLALAAVLTWLSPFFAFLAFAGYAHSYQYLGGRWRQVGVAVSGGIAAFSQLGGSFADFTPVWVAGWLGLAAINAGFAGGLTAFQAFSAEQTERRRQMIIELDGANRRLSDSLAENAALHARLLAQARESGVLDERARLAREIHDTIAQGLTGIVTQLEAARTGGAETAGAHVDTAAALARESLTEARRSVEALAPGRLTDARLPDAVTDLAKSWAETSGVAVQVEVTGDPRPLLPDIEVTLFRMAQESLANVGKHAGATRVGVTLSYMDDVVVLDVRDDGAGFDPSAGATGFGLPGMEQRVRRVSGTLDVETSPGEGTAVSACVPAIAAEVDG
jgi:signal transduction histidine kinase